MELTKQERKFAKSTAEVFGSLSLGLWSVALLGYFTSGISCMTYFSIGFGVLFAMFSIYLVLPCDLEKKSFLECLEAKRIMVFTKFLRWLVVLSAFAVTLVRTKVDWLVITGWIFASIALLVFYAGLWRAGTDYRKKKLKEAKMEAKGRKNIKKSKKTKLGKQEAKKK